MSSGGCILVTNLTGCKNKTNVSPKRKMRRMYNYLMEELGEKSSCFSPVPAEMVNYVSEIHQFCAHVNMDWAAPNITLSHFVMSKK